MLEYTLWCVLWRCGVAVTICFPHNVAADGEGGTTLPAILRIYECQVSPQRMLSPLLSIPLFLPLLCMCLCVLLRFCLPFASASFRHRRANNLCCGVLLCTATTK